MITSHPTEAMVQQYVAGDLSAAASLVVAAHLDMCPHCQQLAQIHEEQLAFTALAKSIAPSDTDMQQMLDTIFNSAPALPKSEPPIEYKQDNAGLFLEGRRFQLPPTLARQQSRIRPWSKMPGKLWRATMALGTTENVSLMYIGTHTSIPEHTHKGTELQLVLQGSFVDEFGRYHDGDLILLDSSHRHTPKTAEEDCLILAVLDAPLHFTSGISRLLNPFSSLFFR